MNFYCFEFYMISIFPNITIFDFLLINAVSIFPIFYPFKYLKTVIGDTTLRMLDVVCRLVSILIFNLSLFNMDLLQSSFSRFSFKNLNF